MRPLLDMDKHKHKQKSGQGQGLKQREGLMLTTNITLLKNKWNLCTVLLFCWWQIHKKGSNWAPKLCEECASWDKGLWRAAATYFASFKPVASGATAVAAAAARGLLKALLTLRLRPETGQDLCTDSDTERGSSSSRGTVQGGRGRDRMKAAGYTWAPHQVCVRMRVCALNGKRKRIWLLDNDSVYSWVLSWRGASLGAGVGRMGSDQKA